MLHKLLVSQKRREAAKRDKELAYLYDLALVSRDHWQSIKDKLDELRSARRLPSAWWQTAHKTATKVFGETTAQGPIAVTRIYASIGESRSEAGVERVMARFFKEVGLIA